MVINGSVGKLKAILQVPVTAKSGKIPLAIICHGFMNSKDGSLVKCIADSLEEHGIASIRFDFVGHGESEGAQTDMTVPREIEDAKSVYAYARKLPYVGDIAMVGHSQGGVVTAMTSALLTSERIKAMVLLSPAAALRDDALRGNLFGTAYDAANPPESVTILGGAYTIGQQYVKTAQDLPIYETARTYEGQALIIHGKADNIVPYTYGKRFHDEIRHSHFNLIEGEDHMYQNRENRPAGIVAQFLERELK